jgi:peptidoglycan hydrolase-like protein with peptidoglycan-binding domain
MRLSLTSPMMRGKNVTALQHALKKKDYLQGAADGVFGPETARAVKRAKYWLGYKTVDTVAGDLLMGYLTGTRPLTPALKARGERRKHITKAQKNRLKMIGEARNWLGTKESPSGSNRVLFSNWYGMTGPWCAMFVTYCGVKHGVPFFLRGSRWAYVPYMVYNARAGNYGLAVTHNPQEGDLVTFDWDNDRIADHIGFFDHWTNAQRTQFATIEGNTAIGNNSNGGQVMRRERNKSDVEAFIHVAG